jgi:RimJ/RimL family protein N-acetyltransferase
MVPVVAPRISTPRLVLRQLESRDFDAFANQLMDATAMAPLSPVPTRAAAWQKLASFNGMWTLTGAGWWAVEVRETRELAGTVGAFFRETSLVHGALPDDADLEIGWTIHPAHRRQGIATEAARAALAHAFERHPVKRAIAHVDPPNIASARVCEALGMSLEGEVEFYATRLMRWIISRH